MEKFSIAFTALRMRLCKHEKVLYCLIIKHIQKCNGGWISGLKRTKNCSRSILVNHVTPVTLPKPFSPDTRRKQSLHQP